MIKSVSMFAKAKRRGCHIEPEAKMFCNEYGRNVTQLSILVTSDELVKFAEEIRHLSILKIFSHYIIRLFGVGAVKFIFAPH